MFHLLMKHCVECLILLLKEILEEIKDAKMSSFSPDFQHSLNIHFLCIFFMNY